MEIIFNVSTSSNRDSHLDCVPLLIQQPSPRILAAHERGNFSNFQQTRTLPSVPKRRGLLKIRCAKTTSKEKRLASVEGTGGRVDEDT